MEKINGILDALKDGEWHNLKDIAKTSGLRSAQVKIIMNFLAEYDLVSLNKEYLKVKLSAPMLKFIHEIQKLEENENLAEQVS